MEYKAINSLSSHNGGELFSSTDLRCQNKKHFVFFTNTEMFVYEVVFVKSMQKYVQANVVILAVILTSLC